MVILCKMQKKLLKSINNLVHFGKCVKDPPVFSCEDNKSVKDLGYDYYESETYDKDIIMLYVQTIHIDDISFDVFIKFYGYKDQQLTIVHPHNMETVKCCGYKCRIKENGIYCESCFGEDYNYFYINDIYESLIHNWNQIIDSDYLITIDIDASIYEFYEIIINLEKKVLVDRLNKLLLD